VTAPIWQRNLSWPAQPTESAPETDPATALPIPAAEVTHCPACRRAVDEPGPGCSFCPPPPAQSFRGKGAVAPVLAPLTGSRWEKSTVTFGPFGRIMMTILVLAPIPVLVLSAATGFAIVGLGIWLFLVTPWALRDIWRTTRRKR
jgi:hypothetical protein